MKKNHVWIIETLLNDEWAPVMNSCRLTEDYAEITKGEYEACDPFHEYRVTKYEATQ